MGSLECFKPMVFKCGENASQRSNLENPAYNGGLSGRKCCN